MDTKRLRQRVLDLAIHGKLVPQNPQDEPASELLKRIAAEKERLVKEGKIKKSKKKDNEDIDEVPFEVPQGWVWCRLEDITSQITDGEHKTPKRVKSYCGYYLLSARNVLNGSINLNDVDYVDKEEYDIISRRCNPVLGDILISCSGTVGRIAVIKDNNKYVMVRSAAVAKPLFVISDYLLYTPQSPELQMQIEERSKQTAQANLFQGEIRMLQIPLPPLAEQHRIVSEVEKYFSLIDILEESGNDLQQSIQKAKSKILDLAIKGKLVEQNEEDEPVTGDLTGPFELPNNWRWSTLSQCNKYKPASIDPSRFPDTKFELYSVPSYETGMPEFVQGANISSSKKVVEESDVLLCKINPHLNRAWIVCHYKKNYPCIASSEWIIMRNDLLSPKYLAYCFTSPYFRGKMLSNVSGVGGSLMRAQPSSVNKYPIPLPPIAEQHRIVARIEELFTQLENIAEALK